MALDAQSNYNIEMPQLKLPLRQAEPIAPNLLQQDLPYRNPPTKDILLPIEIISHILYYIPRRSQPTIWACTLVSRAWYTASISLLYERPYLGGGNFNQFVNTVCPSKNAHIRQSALAVLVRRLDMGELVHSASRSLTARLLGRLKGNIVEFVAPQASFAINSFAALGKCTKMKYLDLSLISASISNKLLFQTLTHLQELETLFFPRSSSHDQDRNDTASYTWPPKLKALHLAGGVDDSFLKRHLVNAPASLERLSIQSCPQVHAFALLDILEILGPQLRHLTIRHPMTQLYTGTFDYILTSCVALEALRVSADYISNNLFSVACMPSGHPLRILDLDCSITAGAEVDVSPGEIYLAVEEGRLSDLRSVRVSARLAWAATERTRQDASDLAEILEEMEDERPLGIPTGVWTMSEKNAGKAVDATSSSAVAAPPVPTGPKQHRPLAFRSMVNDNLDDPLKQSSADVATAVAEKGKRFKQEELKHFWRKNWTEITVDFRKGGNGEKVSQAGVVEAVELLGVRFLQNAKTISVDIYLPQIP